MSKRTYYIEEDGGYVDTELANVRKKAIDHLCSNPKDEEVTVWSSPSVRRVVVGKVVLNTRSRPLFIWISGRHSRSLFPSGQVYNKPN